MVRVASLIYMCSINFIPAPADIKGPKMLFDAVAVRIDECHFSFYAPWLYISVLGNSKISKRIYPHVGQYGTVGFVYVGP